MPNSSPPATFGTLWGMAKGMNTTALPQTAPFVVPNRSSGDLLRQARKKQAKGQSRNDIAAQLAISTARRAATVQPAPAAASAAPGFGGSGYSGNVAAQLGHASNPGTVTPPPKPATQS